MRGSGEPALTNVERESWYSTASEPAGGSAAAIGSNKKLFLEYGDFVSDQLGRTLPLALETMAGEVVRALATLLLVALSVAVWKLLLQPSQQTQVHEAAASSAAPPRAKAAKKKTKKRTGKKAAPATAQDVPVSGSAAAAPAAVTATALPDAAASESDDESDEDEGLSAAQILARRKFTTTRAIGGGGKSRSAAATQQRQLNVPKYELNERVFARFQGGSEWFPGTITEVRRGNEYHITYDDGELEYHVPFKLIKPRSAPGTAVESTDTLEPPPPPPSASASGPDDARDHASSSSDAGESDEDDGWSIVGASNAKRPKAKVSDAPSATSSDGLTKRQRESRRKRERQREIKELARAQAQENGLHAKWGGTHSKMKYVPPPTQA